MNTQELDNQNKIISMLENLTFSFSLMQESINELREDVNVLKEDVKVLKKDVNNLKEDVNNLKVEVKVLKDNVTNLNERFDRLESTVIRIEITHGQKLDALFDAYSMNNDQHKVFDKRLTSLEHLTNTHSTMFLQLAATP